MKLSVIRTLVKIILIIVIFVAAVLCFYTIREYRPAAQEEIVISDNGTDSLRVGDSITLLSYNIGYGALSSTEDFFMDGGEKVRPDDKELVEKNLAGIASIIKEQDADICFLQEVDTDARRSYHINEQKVLEQELSMKGIFACNYKCDFVPYPFPPIGKVNAGILTMTNLKIEEATRIALPESFQWPIKTCNLKRCMLETRIPIEGSDRELVLINFHLEAYDSGEGKIAQSRMLAGVLQEEYEKGNYVIAGGDFNQTFEGIDKYPILNSEYWVPGRISESDFPEGFRFAVADNVPTCRLLNAPYSGNYTDSQVYVIDGFLVSENILVEKVENIDMDFIYSDHQPVKLQVTLQKD